MGARVQQTIEERWALVMKKNVAGQKIGGQMVSATDGSAFTGAVTIAVTGDAGTQATGSVGSGACTHEGSGYHTYAPAQAETNYDLIAFTLTGSGAIPATIQVFTDFPQTGDAFITAGNVETDTQDIQGRLPAALVSGRIDSSVGSMVANSIAVGVIATNAIGSSQLAGDAIATIQSGLSTLTQANVRTAVGLASANLDTQVGDIPTNAELATALGTADDATLAAIAALNNLSQANVRTAVGLASANLDTQIDTLPTAIENADALLKRDMSAVTGESARSPLNSFRFNRNRFTIAGSTLTVFKEDDSTVAWTATITTAAGNPLNSSDPA